MSDRIRRSISSRGIGVLIALVISSCVLEPSFRAELVLEEDQPLVSIPPTPVRCYGMHSAREDGGLELELDALDADDGIARYRAPWTSDWWVYCPRPDIDLGTARCPTPLDNIDRPHWWDCFKITE